MKTMIKEKSNIYKDILFDIFEALDKGDYIELAIKKILDKYSKSNLISYSVSGDEYKINSIELKFRLDSKTQKIVSMTRTKYLVTKMKKSAVI